MAVDTAVRSPYIAPERQLSTGVTTVDLIWNRSAAEVRRIFFASSDSPTVTPEIARGGFGSMVRGSVCHDLSAEDFVALVLPGFSSEGRGGVRWQRFFRGDGIEADPGSDGNSTTRGELRAR